MITRRVFMAAAGAAFARQTGGLKIGVMDGVLGKASKPEAVALAKSFGLAGLQVTLGRTPEGGLALEDSALQSSFVAESKKHGVPLDATYIDILHANCLKERRQGAGACVEGDRDYAQAQCADPHDRVLR